MVHRCANRPDILRFTMLFQWDGNLKSTSSREEFGPSRHLMHGFLPHKHRRKRSKNIARARVRASAVQPGTHPKAVLRWAWKGSGLGSQSDSVWILYWRMKIVGYEKAKVSEMRKWNLTDQ